MNADLSIDSEVDVGNDSVSDDNDKYGMIYDKSNDANPPLLPLESNMPCIHSIIGEVNEDFQFCTNISNWEPHGNDTYNHTVPNQAKNNRPANGESKIVLLRSSEFLNATTTTATVIWPDIVSIKDISSNLNVVAAATATEVNEEFRFWDNRKDYDAHILNVESEFVFTHDYGDNGDIILIDTVYETVNQY